MNLYEILGIVNKNSTRVEIKKAYRILAKRHHPDKNGGIDPFGNMSKIAEAYAVLSKPELKKMYDETGEIPKVVAFESEVATILSVVLIKALKHKDVSNKNIIFVCKGIVRSTQRDIQNELSILKETSQRHRLMITTTLGVSQGDNLQIKNLKSQYSNILNETITSIDKLLKDAKHRRLLNYEVLKRINQLSSKIDVESDLEDSTANDWS